MDKKEYLNRILDMQSKIGGDDIYINVTNIVPAVESSPLFPK